MGNNALQRQNMRNKCTKRRKYCLLQANLSRHTASNNQSREYMQFNTTSLISSNIRTIALGINYLYFNVWSALHRPITEQRYLVTKKHFVPNINPPITTDTRSLRVHTTKYYAVLGFVALTALLHTSVSMAWQGALSADEEIRLQQLSSSLEKQKAPVARSVSNSSIDSGTSTTTSTATVKVPGALSQLGREVLLTELVYRKNGKKKNSQNRVDNSDQPRIAEMFVFDYDTGITTRYEIDLATDNILREDNMQSIYLPLNDNEQTLATRLVTADSTVMTAVNNEYLKQFQQPLAELDDLLMKVSIWKPNRTDTSAVATECRTDRCAQISLFSRSNFSLSVEPVVNLKQMTVHKQAFR